MTCLCISAWDPTAKAKTAEDDHTANSLRQDCTHPSATQRPQTLQPQLSGYDITVKHRPGKMRGNAEAMSRAPIATEAVAFIASALKRSAITADSEDDYHITYAEFDDISSDATEGMPWGACWLCRGVIWAQLSPRSFCCQAL